MAYLLDTQAFLWFIAGDERLSIAARAAIEDTAHPRSLSIASAWEIAIKLSLGKLTLAEPLDVLLPRELKRNGIHVRDIALPHLFRLTAMPFLHRDPFDRLIAAQELTDNLIIVSSDAAFDGYGVSRIW
jgi:PIN domain nuclease of toxin-antitoxin system